MRSVRQRGRTEVSRRKDMTVARRSHGDALAAILKDQCPVFHHPRPARADCPSTDVETLTGQNSVMMAVSLFQETWRSPRAPLLIRTRGSLSCMRFWSGWRPGSASCTGSRQKTTSVVFRACLTLYPSPLPAAQSTAPRTAPKRWRLRGARPATRVDQQKPLTTSRIPCNLLARP